MQDSKKAYGLLIIFIIVYGLVTFGLPPDPEVLRRYEMSALQLRLVSLTVIIPLALIWFLSVYGYLKFREYAQLIRKNPDGKAFSYISTGLAFLALGLPLTSLMGTFVSYITRVHPSLIPMATVANHYVGIILSLLAFGYIYKGSKELLRIAKGRPQGRDWSLMLAGYVTLALAYAYLVLSNPARNNPGASGGTSIFFLPDWLIVVTIILPYLYVWYIGLLSGFYINFYQKKVGGLIYKNAFRYLGWGLIAAIGGSILRQYVTAISNLLADLRLTPLLLLVYSLLITIAIGYILIAIGARKLKRIEEA